MASFTDAISQFNPYVQQLPVEVMAKVGMQKQAQYDAGVQKIQSYIDNVAGLEVARGVDKQLLQSKLNTLGGNLKVISAGDFSNQQLVNSVGGMASEIVNDKQIQNAVRSTANLKNQEAIIQKAREKGELGIENEDLYNTQRDQYLSSTDADASFANGKYIPYINMFKVLEDAAKSVGEDSQKVKQLFETDANGNPIPEYAIDKKGNKIFKGYKPSFIAKTETVAGKSVDKVLKAFNASLTPAHYQQLAITGRYNYKGYTPEQLQNVVSSGYSDELNRLSSAIDKTRIQLIDAENSAKPDDEKIKGLAYMYEQLNAHKDDIQESLNKDLQLAATNPDAVKGSLYTKMYLSNMAQTMASKKYEEDYELSPTWDIYKANRDFNRQVAQDRIDNYYKGTKEARERDKEKREVLEFQIKYGIDESGRPIGVPDDIDIEKDDVASQVVNQVNDSYASQMDNVNSMAYDLTAQYFKSLPGGENLTNDQLRVKIANTLKKYGKPMEAGSENEILNKFASRMVAKYNTNRNDVAIENRGLIEKYKNTLTETAYLRSNMQDIDNEAIKIAKEQGIDVTTIKEIEKSIKPKTFTFASTQGPMSVTLSKDDMRDFAIIGGEATNIFGGLFTSADEQASVAAANRRLRSKYGNRYDFLVNNLITLSPDTGHATLNPEISNITDKIKDSNLNKLNKIKAKLYKDSNYIARGSRVNLFMDESNKEALGNKLDLTLTNYADVVPNVEALKADVVAGKFKASVDARPVGLGGDSEYFLELTNGAGKTTSIPINVDYYKYLTGVNPPENRGVPGFVRQLDRKGTTNATGRANPNAGNKFSDSDFTNYNGPYGLTGDYVKDTGDPNSYWFKIYVHDKEQGKHIKTTTFPQRIPKYINGAINPDLNTISKGINNNVLEQFMNRK